MTKEIIVLAFSGGLDTSYCLLDLKTKGFEVHAAFVDTGGVSQSEKDFIKERALSLGVDEYHLIDASKELWDEFVTPLIWSHAKILDQYPLLCSDRYIIVAKCLALCDFLDTKNFSHGCTGMGNDQLRFDQTVRSLGDYNILAPIRELQSKTREVRAYEIEALEKAGHEVRASNSTYSINENILGVTTSGSEIDDFKIPGEGSRSLCKPRSEWPEGPLTLSIGFEGGIATSLNGEKTSGPKILSRLNRLFGDYGVGRYIYTGDVSIGLKGRIVFECPGITALQLAHRALEDTCNTRFQNQFRHQISHRWAEMVYTGFFYEPHTQDLFSYLESSQSSINGTVTLTTNGGEVQAVKITSDYMLVDDNSTYAQSADWTPEEAVGFIKLLGKSSTLWAKVQKKNKDENK
ncbi:MAG: argininosuccinate synthase domain-containing protein [Sphingomonadales bacterium]